jgi:hypothetical protein
MTSTHHGYFYFSPRISTAKVRMVKLRIPVVGSGSTLSIRSRSSPSDSFHDENSGAIQGNLRTSLAQFRPRMIMKRRSSQRDDHETANLHYQEEYAGVLSHGAPSRRFRLVGRYLDQRYNNQDSAPLLSNVPQFDTRLEANNVFNWLHDEAPSDVLPRILLFAGPQTMVTLSTLNRSWNSLVMTQHIWKTACEELGKVSPTKSSVYWCTLFRESSMHILTVPSVNSFCTVVEWWRGSQVLGGAL